MRITLHEESVGFHTVNRAKTMQLGFIGSGEITSSIVTGLCSFGATSHSIRLSPRNAAIASELSNRFGDVSVASSNQEVLDHSGTIIIAVRPPAARGVLSELRFGPHHQIISLVSGLSLLSLSRLVAPATRIARAAPLPSTARRLSPTAICPADPAALDLFAELGTVFPVETETQFDAICATTATIASYFAFVERIASWLTQHGIPESKARDYIGQLFSGLTTTAAESPERSFQSFAANHATAGGINEQFLKDLVERGLLTSVSEALDAVLHRINAQSQSTDARTVF
jgi:pyrroline-5-carboxylate reductase